MRAWGVSDPGMVRSENQDAFAICQLGGESLLAMVCDGMGGARAGNIASGLALDVFSGEIRRGWKGAMTAQRVQRLLRSATELANQAVFEQSRSSEDYYGMGTTLVAAVMRGREADVINVGDSRAYHVSDRGIRPVTVDHSMVQLMVGRGELTQAEARRHPGKNIITRAVGTERQVEGDLYHLRLEDGECLLLCSDGLSNVVTDQEILFEVIHGQNREDCCRRLLEIAKNRGAPDNVTAILIGD